MEYKRLTETDKESGIVAAFANDAEILDRLAEIEDKIEQGTLIELPRVARYVDYEYAIEKFVVQWQVNGRIKEKVYFSEKKAYQRLKELQNGN